MVEEKERRKIVKECLKEYYDEDKKILIDASILQATNSIYVIYNLIFFGNKIYYSKETLAEIRKISKKEESSSKREKIITDNAIYFLDAVERDNQDEYKNYNEIDMSRYGSSKKIRIKEFLDQNPDAIFYTAEKRFCEELENSGVERKQVYYYEEGTTEINPFEGKLKFTTLSSKKSCKNREICVYPSKWKSLIKVYNNRLNEKREDERGKIQLSKRNFLLIRNNKKEVYSFYIYEIVSKHSRNNAIRIIYTELKKGEKTNKYIERLPYMYQKLIIQNIPKEAAEEN